MLEFGGFRGLGSRLLVSVCGGLEFRVFPVLRFEGLGFWL